jgi:hypothetical protein
MPTSTPTIEPHPFLTATLHGLTLTVTGQDWLPNEKLSLSLTGTEEYTGEVLVGIIKANRKGAFVFSVTLPNPPGQVLYAIVASRAHSATVPVNMMPLEQKRIRR